MHLRPTPASALGLLAGASLLAGDLASAQEQKFITIGTGGVTEVYYPAGGAICRLVNAGRKEHGIRCSVESTGGSVYNINTIRQGELDFGVVQSDVSTTPSRARGRSSRARGRSRACAPCSPTSRAVHRGRAPDSGIESFDDLKGKRVNVGNPGSGQRSTMEVLMDAKGWTMDDFALASSSSRPSRARRCPTTTSTPSCSRSATRTARSRRRAPRPTPSWSR